MNAREIVGRWLENAGYDGLIADGGECCCRLDDLMSCGLAVEDLDGCEPAKLETCPHCGSSFLRKVKGNGQV